MSVAANIALKLAQFARTTRLEIQPYKDQDFTKEAGPAIVADFNPTDYTLTKANQYEHDATIGASKPTSNFAAGKTDTLKMSFMFDGTGAKLHRTLKSVRQRVDKFLELLKYQGPEHEPPYVAVTWGSFRFQGVLTSATAEYQLFDRDGSPLRVKVGAEFQEIISSTDRQAEGTPCSPDYDRVWLVKAGDRLDRIALESYGHVGYWRQIARANGLKNPRNLVPGSVLSLPRLKRV